MDTNFLYILLYASGVITTLAIVRLLHYKHINKQLTKELSGIVKSKEPERRVGNLIWDGWHKIDKPSVKWETTFELKEVAMSEDETKSKFEVISIFSANTKDETWGLGEYSKHFYQKTNGGWINLNDLQNGNTDYGKHWKFDWVITKSKADIRGQKIDDILNSK